MIWLALKAVFASFNVVATMFQSPGPTLLQLGPITIRWYGLMIAIGFVLATLVLARLSKRLELDSEKIVNCAFIVFLGGVVGARLYFVILSWHEFQDHLLNIFAIWQGGISIHGGIIGGTIVGWLYCRRAKLPVPRVADLLSTVAPLGQAIGRWGNFFNSELFGRPVPSDYPLGLYIPPENRPLPYKDSSFFHPAFLYESVWDLSLFLVLYYFVLPKTYRYPGVTFLLYIFGYSLGRSLIEPLRVDSIMVAGAQAPFVVSVASLVLSAIALIFAARHYMNSAKA
jgi:phosphatidylglycerol---prolipoprotein diacylglyceryl transferase